MAFTAGYNQATTFQLDGAGGATTLQVTDHTWDEEVERLKTTHTGSAGVTACIRGVLDGNGSVKANVDGAALPCATAPGVKAGAKGTITMAVGGSTAFSIHVLVTKVHYQSSNPDGIVNYSFDYGIDSTSGSYTYPT